MKQDSVSAFLDALQHPRRAEIERLREIVLRARPDLEENIKWNAPNYHIMGQDRLTMKIQPPKSFVLLIFHCGASKQTPPARVISDESGLLEWRGNDRAMATFQNMEALENADRTLAKLVQDWIAATI